MSKAKFPMEFMQGLNVDLAKLSPGRQVHFNHKDCPAGEDTRLRLYVKITDDGKMLLAHCFNCGGAGAIRRPTMLRVYNRPHQNDLETQERRIGDQKAWDIFRPFFEVLPSCITESLTLWPNHYFSDCFQEWSDAEAFGTKYNSGAQSVLIPRYVDARLEGVEIRSLAPPRTGVSKWHRSLSPSFTGPLTLVYNITGAKTGVICEDPISAMKLAIAGYAGIAICGCKVPGSAELVRMKLLYDNVIVWLDNDQIKVKETANEILDTLALYSIPSKRVVDNVDPKYYSIVEIKTILTNLIKELQT